MAESPRSLAESPPLIIRTCRHILDSGRFCRARGRPGSEIAGRVLHSPQGDVKEFFDIRRRNLVTKDEGTMVEFWSGSADSRFGTTTRLRKRKAS